jgi:hypothetical protein
MRSIVPALGSLALITASAAFGEDATAPAPATPAAPAAPAAAPAAPAATPDAGPPGATNVVMSGWIDNFLTINNQFSKVQNDPATAKDEKDIAIKFVNEASIKVNWKVTDALTARINLWLTPDHAADNLNVRESFISYSLNDDLTWTIGRYINHIGWLSAEPTGLYRPNASLIGYTNVYGNDVYGTNIAYADKDVPFTGSFHVTNGYYTPSDGASAGQYTPTVSPYRQNYDLGYGLDLIYNFPGSWSGSSLNLEGAYDVHSGIAVGGTPPPGYEGGGAFELGFNGTLKPPLANQPLMIGFEIQDVGVKDSVPPSGGTDVKDGVNRVQGLVQVNYALSGTSFPISLTGSIEAIDDHFDASGAKNQTAEEYAVAVNTNPLKGSPNLGVNLEFAYVDETAGIGNDPFGAGAAPLGTQTAVSAPYDTSLTSTTRLDYWQVSFEAIATF